MTQSVIGPRKPSMTVYLLRVIGALAGGIIGALSIFAIYILGLSTGVSEGVNPHSLFVVLVLVFGASLITNIATTVLITVLDKELYPRYLNIVTQVFIILLVLFVFSTPMYLIIASIPLGDTYIKYIAVLHLLLSIQVASIVMELFSNSYYKVVSLYGIAFGSILSISVTIIMYMYDLSVILFFVLPSLVWVSIEFFRGIVEVLYYYFYRFYGIDALNTDTNLTEDE